MGRAGAWAGTGAGNAKNHAPLRAVERGKVGNASGGPAFSRAPEPQSPRNERYYKHMGLI